MLLARSPVLLKLVDVKLMQIDYIRYLHCLRVSPYKTLTNHKGPSDSFGVEKSRCHLNQVIKIKKTVVRDFETLRKTQTHVFGIL